MARLQILELPTEHHGDDMVTPWLLVIDEYEPMRYIHSIGDDPQPVDEFVATAELTGARAVLAFRETVHIPANGPAPDAEGVEVSDTDFTEMASVVRRALGIDMTQVGVKPDMAAWLLTACRELEKSEAARERLHAELGKQAADLEQLRAGEELVTDSRIVPTPAQWIWQWSRATPEKRLSMAAQILDGMPRANDCFMADHEAQIATLRAEVERLRTGQATTSRDITVDNAADIVAEHDPSRCA